MPELATTCDVLDAARDGVEVARDRAIAALDALLAGRDKEQRRPLIRAIKALRRGVVPELPEDAGDAAGAIGVFARETERANVAARELDDAFARVQQHELAVFERVANHPRFREAVTWQNRGLVHTALAMLAPDPGQPITRKRRKHHHVVASYLQRYCVKNDAAGFFGPGVWGRVDPSADAIDFVPGPGLLAARRLYFEYWGIARLAEHIARDDELKPALAPRRVPTVWLDGTQLHYPVDRVTELPAEFAAVLRACDGERTAAELASALLADGEVELEDADEVYALLGELEERAFITWTLELPTALAHPERTLRALLERAGQPGARGLAMLDELEAAFSRVARAGGDADAVDRAIGELEATFERLTSESATRSAGQMYAGRMLVFESCQRDFDFRVGRDFLSRVGPAVTPILKSSRWYTHVIASRYRERLSQAYRDLAHETGASTIDFIRFWERVSSHFPGGREPAPIIREAREGLQQRWTRILGLDREPAPRTIELRAGDIAAAVEREFGSATGPGWPSARYHSIDVMIYGRGPDAIRRGAYSMCLGELHAGVDNTANPANRDQHPDPGSLIRARELDLGTPTVAAVRAKDQAKFGGQLAMSPRDLDLELGEARSWRPRASVLEVGSLVVELAGEQLVVRDRRSAHAFDILALMQDYILAEEEAAGGLSLFPSLARMPLVTLDGVVLAREQWRLPPTAVPFAHDDRGAGQFHAARRWARELGLPRWVFVKTPEEVKPVFIDLDCPVYVELLARLARAASRLTISAMLPTFDDLWLPDGEGNLYTSELRMLALDPVAFAAPSSPA